LSSVKKSAKRVSLGSSERRGSSGGAGDDLWLSDDDKDTSASDTSLS
jgi:hypothetical protein